LGSIGAGSEKRDGRAGLAVDGQLVTADVDLVDQEAKVVLGECLVRSEEQLADGLLEPGDGRLGVEVARCRGYRAISAESFAVTLSAYRLPPEAKMATRWRPLPMQEMVPSGTVKGHASPKSSALIGRSALLGPALRRQVARARAAGL
jgi:hypothetical protein